MKLSPPSALPLSERELSTWFAFLQAHTNLTRRLDADLQEAHRLSLVEHTVLHRLELAGGHLRMSELAASVYLSPSGVSRLVDRLVAARLIERQTCPSDGRAVHAVLTRAGARRLREAEATYAASLRQDFLERFGEGELERLGGLLLRLASHCRATA